METNSIQPNNYRRIARFISGEMNWPERVWFSLLLACNSNMKRLSEEMKNDWNKTGDYFNNMNINTSKAWSKLYQRLENDNLLSANEESTIVRFKPQVYLKYAAVVLFAVVISGIGGYKYFNPELVALANNSNQNTVITTLPDGTTIYLAQNSTITYAKRFVGKSRNVKLEGEAFFDVAKDPEKPFVIETKAASVKVLGTSFNLKSTNSTNFELSVVEGKVGVNLNSNKNENVVAIAGDKVMTKDNKLIRERVLSFKTTKSSMVRLQFQDESLSSIINVINKTYGSSLQLSGESLKNKKISVTFENDISSIVNILSVSFNLELTHQLDSTIILKEK
ncbi:MAG TPA: FecR family protein [Tenuifilaceae bacterium]|nr:FecR family protein [Tenuifilaceae bacterium]HPI43707.1 FecR family protein [Tenuifilaceae bacterium]HPN22844.1 FecR family protein [Tenuifilaceae bacterium]